jgi:hypothetical protein
MISIGTNKNLIGNGTPGGFKNCFEGGCERCNSNAVNLFLKS